MNLTGEYLIKKGGDWSVMEIAYLKMLEFGWPWRSIIKQKGLKCIKNGPNDQKQPNISSKRDDMQPINNLAMPMSTC